MTSPPASMTSSLASMSSSPPSLPSPPSTTSPPSISSSSSSMSSSPPASPSPPALSLPPPTRAATWPPYSRDSTIAAILDFYNFLITMGAIDESSIVTPPASGWPGVTDEMLAPLGKNEEVNDLLRHLPYISGPGNTAIAYKTHVIPYTSYNLSSSFSGRTLEGVLVPVAPGVIPAHVAVLTEGPFYGSWLLLDTQEGTITDYILGEHPEREVPLDSPDHWRAYKTLPIVEFFEDWKENFRSLNWVALPHDADDGMLLQLNCPETDEIRDIYRANGWPDNYNREKCKQELFEWDERKRAKRRERWLLESMVEEAEEHLTL